MVVGDDVAHLLSAADRLTDTCTPVIEREEGAHSLPTPTNHGPSPDCHKFALSYKLLVENLNIEQSPSLISLISGVQTS